jgi:hypothetical protein
MVTTPLMPGTTLPITITLSREELYVVMCLLKAKQIPGFGLEWLHSVADGSLPGDIRRTLEVAANSLIARGYVVPVKQQENQELLVLEMPAPIIALVGSCAFSEFAITLSVRHTSESRVFYLHGLHELGVVHSMPYSNIHQFEAVDRRHISDVVDELLELHSQPASLLQRGAVHATTIELVRDLAESGRVEEAINVLVDDGMMLETAQAFAYALPKASTVGTVMLRTHGIGTSNSQAIQMICSIVITPKVCFLLTVNEHSDSINPSVFIQAIASDALREKFATYIPDLNGSGHTLKTMAEI